MSFTTVLTNAGRTGVAKLIGGVDSVADFTYIALGTGTSAAATSDTALQTETSATGLARTVATSISESPTYSTKWEETFTNSSGGAVTVTEVGILSASSGGTLLLHGVDATGHEVANSSSITITVTLSVASA